MKNQSSKYSHRYLACFIIEAETPIAVGSGEKDMETDSLVALDVNGLPYLPGTTIAGVVRSMFDAVDNNPLWGYQEKKDGHGSEIIFSEGRILNSKGEVMDGLRDNSVFDDDILKHYAYLPIRQHVRISSKGVADNAGKFDEQVVYAGTRFCFELEMVSDGENKDKFDELINAVRMETFRLGGGSRKGFGKIKVVFVKTADIDLRDKAQADLYLKKSSNLKDCNEWWNGQTNQCETDAIATDKFVTYHIELHPQDFIFFGSGLADENGDADMTTVKAKRIHWDSDGCGRMQEDLILIPASALKGALRHRVAYNFNKIKQNFIDTKEGIPDTPQNEAVKALFGFADTVQQCGKVLFSDIIEDPKKQGKAAQTHLFNHVAIDRFTGGTINGALFTEQADYVAGQTYETDILVSKEALTAPDIKAAWEKTLDDLCGGLLPLGGSTNRGHGIFTGKWEIK